MTITCPYCKVEVKGVRYGYGIVWICHKCNRVIDSRSARRADDGEGKD